MGYAAQGVIEHITINNPSVGRSVDEAKRLLQAVQFVAEHGEVCLQAPCSKSAFLAHAVIIGVLEDQSVTLPTEALQAQRARLACCVNPPVDL